MNPQTASFAAWAILFVLSVFSFVGKAGTRTRVYPAPGIHPFDQIAEGSVERAIVPYRPQFQIVIEDCSALLTRVTAPLAQVAPAIELSPDILQREANKLSTAFIQGLQDTLRDGAIFTSTQVLDLIQLQLITFFSSQTNGRLFRDGIDSLQNSADQMTRAERVVAAQFLRAIRQLCLTAEKSSDPVIRKSVVGLSRVINGLQGLSIIGSASEVQEDPRAIQNFERAFAKLSHHMRDYSETAAFFQIAAVALTQIQDALDDVLKTKIAEFDLIASREYIHQKIAGLREAIVANNVTLTVTHGVQVRNQIFMTYLPEIQSQLLAIMRATKALTVVRHSTQQVLPFSGGAQYVPRPQEEVLADSYRELRATIVNIATAAAVLAGALMAFL